MDKSTKSDCTSFNDEQTQENLKDNSKLNNPIKKDEKSGNSATVFPMEKFIETFEKANKATAHLFEGGIFSNRNLGVNTEWVETPRNVDTHHTVTTPGSEFNITGGTIEQAAIGNQGDVVFNKNKKVFEEGSTHNDIAISGGNFTQANLGGKAEYNNKGAKIKAGSDEAGPGGPEIFSPEQLALHILERGVTADQFLKLLERRYTLANLAFALPKHPLKRNKVVEALLMEEMETDVH